LSCYPNPLTSGAQVGEHSGAQESGEQAVPGAPLDHFDHLPWRDPIRQLKQKSMH
jgi:hypothetical protein